MEEVNRELNKAEARPKNGASTSRRGVRHGAVRRTRFRNPVDLGGFLDFSLDFWISGFQSGFLDFKVDFWISSGFLDFKEDFWISLFLKIQLMNNHEPHSSQPIC